MLPFRLDVLGGNNLIQPATSRPEVEVLTIYSPRERYFSAGT